MAGATAISHPSDEHRQEQQHAQQHVTQQQQQHIMALMASMNAAQHQAAPVAGAAYIGATEDEPFVVPAPHLSAGSLQRVPSQPSAGSLHRVPSHASAGSLHRVPSRASTAASHVSSSSSSLASLAAALALGDPTQVLQAQQKLQAQHPGVSQPITPITEISPRGQETMMLPPPPRFPNGGGANW